jgi:long-subunit acyl-CoA synthetase (AMP-forming)
MTQIYYTSLYLGIIGAGGCFTGANPGYTSYELIHHLRVTEAKYVITHLAMLITATTAAGECGIPRSNIFVFNVHGEDVPDGHRSWTELLQHGDSDWTSVADPNKTAAAYVSTSGTSGLPKAAILSHSYMVSQADTLSRTLYTSRKVRKTSFQTYSNQEIVLSSSGFLPRGTSTISRLPYSDSTCNAATDGMLIICHATVRATALRESGRRFSNFSNSDSPSDFDISV